MTATVTDSDGASDTDNQVVVVTVANVAPTVTLAAGNDLTVNEGTTEHTYNFTVTDPGVDTFTVVSAELRRQWRPGRRDTFNDRHGWAVSSAPSLMVRRRASCRSTVKDSDGAEQQRRHPDGHGRQCRSDGDLVGR